MQVYPRLSMCYALSLTLRILKLIRYLNQRRYPSKSLNKLPCNLAEFTFKSARRFLEPTSKNTQGISLNTVGGANFPYVGASI